MKSQWPVARTALLWVLGVLNTLLIAPGQVGTWRNDLGYLFLVLAAIDTIHHVVRLRRRSASKRAER